jgi:uncharacterized protein YodC (DUF2158 family)
MAQKFKPGDIVALKSGGPPMTVTEELSSHLTGRPTNYQCQWFAGKKLEAGIFPADALDAAKTNGSHDE